MLAWKRRPGSRATRASDLSAFIDEGSEIEGRYTFRGTVMLNGKFSGEIDSRDALIIGDTGRVDGTIRVGSLLVSGEVVGKAFASQRIELRGRARVIGDIETPVLVVEEGVLFEGACRMSATTSATGTSAVPPATRDLSVVPLKR